MILKKIILMLFLIGGGEDAMLPPCLHGNLHGRNGMGHRRMGTGVFVSPDEKTYRGIVQYELFPKVQSLIPDLCPSALCAPVREKR